MTGRPTKKLKTSFDAQDGEGNTHRLDVLITSQLEIASGTKKHEDRTSIITRGGRSVKRLKKGKYEMLLTGEILTSEDPQAP